MKRLAFLAAMFGVMVRKAVAQSTTGVKILAKNNGVSVELKPTGGIVADISRGLLRTAINGGLRGVPGYAWIVNQAGDGQAARIVGGRVAYETTPTGVMPMFVIDVPPVPPALQVKTGVVCRLVEGTPNVWTVPFAGAIADIAVYRNGLRQSREPSTATNPYQPDYTLSADMKTITPNFMFPWSINRTEVSIPPNERIADLIIADVFFY